VESLCLDAAKRFGHRRHDCVQVLGISLAERFGGTDPPQVQERPATEAIAEDERSHVDDVVSRQ